MVNKLNEILKFLGVPYARGNYNGKSNIYIIWNLYYTDFSLYKNNKASERIEYVSINIYSKSNYEEIKEKLIQKINDSEDFTLLDIEKEDYEEETGYYHCPVRVMYL